MSMSSAVRLRLMLGAATIALAAGPVAAQIAAPVQPAPGETPAQASAPSAVQAGSPTEQTSTNQTDAPGPQEQEQAADIVVTGIRQSIRSAINEKRSAVNIVDVINAEDVGKLPDQNLAEVAGNIPGVQIDRSNGVGNRVSIRGSDQNLVLINGRVTPPAADARGGISFDNVPAELIASLRVTKVPTADQIEGSVGGIVDLRTYRALGLKQPLRVIRGSMEYSENNDAYNPSVVGIVSQTFDTGIGDIGIVLSGNYQRQRVREDILNVRYYIRPQTAIVGASPTPASTIDLSGDGRVDPYLYPGFVGQYSNDNHRTNKTLSGTAEWQTTDTLKLFVDGLYVKQDQHAVQPGLFIQPPLTEQPLTNAAFEPRTVAGVTYYQMTKGTLGGEQWRSTGESPQLDTRTFLAAGGGEWNTDDLTVKFEGSYTGSNTRQANFQLVAQYTNPGPSFNSAAGRISPPLLFDLTRPDLFLSLDYNSPLAANIGNPAYYSTFIARDNITHYRNRDAAGRIDASWRTDWGLLKSIDYGLRVNRFTSRRTKTTQVSRQFPGFSAASRPDLYGTAPTNFFDFADGRYIQGYVVANALTSDPDAARAAVGLSLIPPQDLSAQFGVKERNLAAYGKLNIETTVLGLGIRGEIGARVVQTKQTASGLRVVGTTATPTSQTQKYTNVLPGIIFSAEPLRSVVLRASYGRSLRRPDFGDIAPTAVFPVINNYVAVGNPDLKPQTVDQYDIGAEWYFDRNSLLSVGGFYKKYHDLVVTVAVPPALRDPALGFFNQSNCIGGIFNPVAVDLTGAVGICTGINQPANQGSATLKGLEAAFQHSFTYLPGPLSGLGVIANYTYQDGKRSVPFTVPAALIGGQVKTIQLGLRNLSKNNYNLTLFYEKYGINARVFYSYRTAFLRLEATDVTNNYPFYQAPRGQLNASVTLDVNKQFAVTFSGVNLTSAPNKERELFENGPTVQERSAGRRFEVGVRGSF